MNYLILLIVLTSNIFAQIFEVQNITASQRTDGSHIVDVCYDLSPDDLFISFRVWSELSIDSAENWMGLSIPTTPNIMGDNVFPGTNKCFEFSLGDYVTDIYTPSAQIKVFAEGHEALELPFEMVPVASGEFMGVIHTPGSWGDDNILSTIDYDYEIMKYEVTNAEFAQFLIEAKENGYLIDCPYAIGDNPSNLCIDIPAQTFLVDNTYWGDTGTIVQPISNGQYHTLFAHGTEPGNRYYSAIYWNGTTFIIDEGYANHPAIRVSYFGAWAFANYYGLRIPSRDEWIKAARGMNDWQASFGPEAGNPTPSDRVNTRNSGDPFDTGIDQNDLSTPVGFYNGEENQWGFETIDSPSPYGTYDQTGNASEWVADMISANYGGSVYMMGGAYNSWWWNGGMAYFNTSNSSAGASSAGFGFGFRCARTINIVD